MKWAQQPATAKISQPYMLGVLTRESGSLAQVPVMIRHQLTTPDRQDNIFRPPHPLRVLYSMPVNFTPCNYWFPVFPTTHFGTCAAHFLTSVGFVNYRFRGVAVCFCLRRLRFEGSSSTFCRQEFQGSAVPSFLFMSFLNAFFPCWTLKSASLCLTRCICIGNVSRRGLTRLQRLWFIVSRYHLASMELDLVRRRLIYLVRYRLIERTQEHVSKEPATIPSPYFKVQRGVGCNLLGITSAFAMPSCAY
jgi:hypothetical protein